MRLIDADLLKESIVKWLKPSKPDETEMIEVADAIVSTMMEIDEQPTAFNTDKVLEQLEDHLFEKYCIEDDPEIAKIVEGGGVNATD